MDRGAMFLRFLEYLNIREETKVEEKEEEEAAVAVYICQGHII